MSALVGTLGGIQELIASGAHASDGPAKPPKAAPAAPPKRPAGSSGDAPRTATPRTE
jgi:hypothetical protein